MKHVLLIIFCTMIALGVQAQTSTKVNLSVFPNPAIEFISVQDDNDVVGSVVIYNMVGKKMKDFEYNKGDRYNVADMPKGMYLVQILDRNKQILTTQKVNKR